jgi:outer membrane receptor protein involved in Fe transport
MFLRRPVDSFPLKTTELWLCAFMVFLFFSSSTPAFAEEPVTEEQGFIEIGDVFAAAKHHQSIQEAPASITIVTDEDIRRYGHRQLKDVVNSVRGFYTYSDRNYEFIGVRGFARLGDYGNRVLQLIDGHTNNENIYGSFFLGQDFGVDMDLVKKIEFIRGPGSALYGSNALFGTVNVITRDGRDVGGLSATVEAGSLNTRGGAITYGNEYENGLDLLVSASVLNSGGADLFFPEFSNPAVSDGWARDADGEKARKFLLKATFGEVSLLGNFVWRETHSPTAAYGTIFNDNRFRSIDQRAFAEVKWERSLDDDQHLKTRLYYDHYRYEGYYPYDYPPVTMNRDDVSGQWAGGEATYDRRFASNRILVGGEIVHHIEADQRNYDEDPLYVYLDDHRSFTSGSLYGQDEWDIAPWLRFSGGLRYDKYSTFGSHVSPKAGLILRPLRGNTIKLLYGQAFRAPNVFEMFCYTNMAPSLYMDNPELKPETIHTYELVLEQDLTSAARMTFSGFHYEIRDLIDQQVRPDGSLQYRNVSRVRSEGAEIGIEVDWPGLLKGHFDYSYQDTRDERTGQWLANSPRHLLKAGVTAPLYREIIHVGAQCRYMGDRLDREGNDVGGGTVTDIHLTADFRKLRLSAGAYNIFDVDGADPVSVDHAQKTIQQNGRNYWFKLGYTF